MKKIILMAAVMASLGVRAQEEEFFMLPLNIEREHCIMDDADGAADGRKGMHRTCLKQKDAPLTAMGTPEIVVCLANFKDVKFTVAETEDSLVELFDKFFNGEDVYGEIGKNPRSLGKYFSTMSDSQFTPHFNVMRPVTVDYTQAQSKSNRTEFRDRALLALDDQVKDRVSDFDANKDGVIDGVIIVYPEAGANTGGKGPHACCWSGLTTTQNGTKYATQLVGPEWGSGNMLNGIGLFAHEMSHMLGLPDMYPTSTTKVDGKVQQPGMDYWSLMDYGEYTNSGYNPTPYTAYEKNYMGWIELTELTEPTEITNMKTLAEGGEAYIVYNDANKSEYYILENRNDNDILYSAMNRYFGSGLMIYHVDENETVWNANTVNNDKNHQRMTIVPANGYFESVDNYLASKEYDKYVAEMVGHLWPLKTTAFSSAYTGTTVNPVTYYGLPEGNNCLTDEARTVDGRTAPAATLYNCNTDGEKLMHKPITEIVQKSDNTISFKFMIKEDPTGIRDLEDGSERKAGKCLKDGRLVIVKDGKAFGVDGGRARLGVKE